MHILGLEGPIGHGKSSVAKFLCDGEPYHIIIESSDVISEVAQKLNVFFDAKTVSTNNIVSINSWISHLVDILGAELNIHAKYEDIEITEAEIKAGQHQKLLIYIDRLIDQPSLKFEEITPSNKDIHRPIIQWLGGHLVKKINDEIWYSEMVKRAKVAEDGGCKLAVLSGLRFLKDAEVVRKHNGKIIRVQRKGLQAQDITEATEIQRPNISPDIIIENNGSLEQLESICHKVIADLNSNDIKFEYKAIDSLT